MFWLNSRWHCKRTGKETELFDNMSTNEEYVIKEHEIQESLFSSLVWVFWFSSLFDKTTFKYNEIYKWKCVKCGNEFKSRINQLTIAKTGKSWSYSAVLPGDSITAAEVLAARNALAALNNNVPLPTAN